VEIIVDVVVEEYKEPSSSKALGSELYVRNNTSPFFGWIGSVSTRLLLLLSLEFPIFRYCTKRFIALNGCSESALSAN